MGLRDKAKDMIQKTLGGIGESLVEDIKIKSFHGFKLDIGECKIKPPSIRLRSDGFKIKLIDRSTGDPIADIPIPVDIKICIPEITIINKKTVDINPKIDILLKPSK